MITRADGGVVLVVTGLRLEAKIAAEIAEQDARRVMPAAAISAEILCGYGAAALGRLQARLQARLAAPGSPVVGLLSFGTAGALRPDLVAGDWVVAHASHAPDGTIAPTHAGWRDALMHALQPLPSSEGRGVWQADFAGSATPVASPQEKRQLHQRTGAAVVDMETQYVAQMAAMHHLPFAAARVVIDSAERPLPLAAQCATRADGTTDLPAVLRSLVSRPRQLPALLALARDARHAQAALKNGGHLLGPRFAAPDFDALDSATRLDRMPH